MPELAQLELLEPTTLPERAISKSKFISGLQCAKLIWHQYNAKELIPPYDASHQAVFDQGHKVGRRARALCAEGFPTANRITILDHCSFCVPA